MACHSHVKVSSVRTACTNLRWNHQPRTPAALALFPACPTFQSTASAKQCTCPGHCGGPAYYCFSPTRPPRRIIQISTRNKDYYYLEWQDTSQLSLPLFAAFSDAALWAVHSTVIATDGGPTEHPEPRLCYKTSGRKGQERSSSSHEQSVNDEHRRFDSNNLSLHTSWRLSTMAPHIGERLASVRIGPVRCECAMRWAPSGVFVTTSIRTL